MKTLLLAALLAPVAAMAATAPMKPTVPAFVLAFSGKSSQLSSHIFTSMLPPQMIKDLQNKLDMILKDAGCPRNSSGAMPCVAGTTDAAIAPYAAKLALLSTEVDGDVTQFAPSRENLSLVPQLTALQQTIQKTPGLDPDGANRLMRDISLLRGALSMPASRLDPYPRLLDRYHGFIADFQTLQTLAKQHTSVLQMAQAFEGEVSKFNAKVAAATLPNNMAADFAKRRQEIVMQAHCASMPDGGAHCCGATEASCIATASGIVNGKGALDNVMGSLLAQIEINKLAAPINKLLASLKDVSAMLKAPGLPPAAVAALAPRLAAVPAAAGCPGLAVDAGVPADPVKSCPKATADTVSAGQAVVSDVAAKINAAHVVADIVPKVNGLMAQVQESRIPAGEKAQDLNQLHQFLDFLNGGKADPGAAQSQFSAMSSQIQQHLQLAKLGLIH